jgi:hypothetical protein
MSNDKVDDGGPAFPKLQYHPGRRLSKDARTRPYADSTSGMSLRDWFAGQALCGALQRMSTPLFRATPMDELATNCYEQADAMLAQRKEEPK